MVQSVQQVGMNVICDRIYPFHTEERCYLHCDKCRHCDIQSDDILWSSPLSDGRILGQLRIT
jgi:hypothetical protein